MPSTLIPPRLCAHCYLTRQRAFAPRERYSATIQTIRSSTRHVPAGTTHHFEGEEPQLATIYSGWAIQYTTLEDGRRQVLRILMPGDFIGMGAVFMGAAQSGVDAVTDVMLCEFPLRLVRDIIELDAEVARQIATLMCLESLDCQNSQVNIGQRSALERLAWSYLDIFERLDARGMVRAGECEMPLTQTILGDALGLAPANVSRLTRELRELELLTVRRSRLVVHNRSGLRQLAMHDGNHLVRPLF